MPQVGAADGDISRLPHGRAVLAFISPISESMGFLGMLPSVEKAFSQPPSLTKEQQVNLRDRIMFGEDLSNRRLELLHASYLGLELSSYSTVLLFPSPRTSSCVSGVRSMYLSN
jgi:hypothetical protein